MKSSFILIILLVLLGTCINAQETNNGFPRLNGQYLGQHSPGNTPEIFAPGIISFGYHEHRLAVSPDGSEIYYTVFSSNPTRAIIMYTKLENHAWTTPSAAIFSDSGMNLHPAFSPDGKRLYFVSTRTVIIEGERRKGADIWFVERRDSSWSKPINPGNSINTPANESSPSVMTDGALFFESNRKSNKNNWNIYCSNLINGIYQQAKELPFPINTEYNEGGCSIASDGSYLLFNSNRPGTLGDDDVYITFKNKNEVWSEPVNAGKEINSKFNDWSPSVTPDGKFIIFSSYRNVEVVTSKYNLYQASLEKSLGKPKPGNGMFYWIDAGFIENLRPKEMMPKNKLNTQR